MKMLAGILSLTLFSAGLSVSFSSPAMSHQVHKGKSNAKQTSAAKPASSVKKSSPCDVAIDHNKAC